MSADRSRSNVPCPPAPMRRRSAATSVAETLRALDIPYIALNPGASYRGLHDSLVNYLGNEAPQMLLCLHEESAVAIAHGYAKVTGQRDGGRGAFQCRADARHHGDLQRLVRPHAGARARRDRPGRRRQAPALDRLDPHRARPGRAGAQLHQMGRPAGLARRRARGAAARQHGSPTPRRRARSTSISMPRCRRRSSPSRCRRSMRRASCRAVGVGADRRSWSRKAAALLQGREAVR